MKVAFVGFQNEGLSADGVVWLKSPTRGVMAAEAMFECLDFPWMTQQERIHLRYLACQQLLEQRCQALWLRRLVKQVPDRLVDDPVMYRSRLSLNAFCSFSHRCSCALARCQNAWPACSKSASRLSCARLSNASA